MSNQEITPANQAEIVAKIVRGSVEDLTPQEMLQYYKAQCDAIGLNPLLRPLYFLRTHKDAPVTLYMGKEGAMQLQALHKVSTEITEEKQFEVGNRLFYQVRTRAALPDGTTHENMGVVQLNGDGRNVENDMLKCVTKSHRRAILAITGNGALDETEIETISGATKVHVDLETGEYTEGETIIVPEYSPIPGPAPRAQKAQPQSQPRVVQQQVQQAQVDTNYPDKNSEHPFRVCPTHKTDNLIFKTSRDGTNPFWGCRHWSMDKATSCNETWSYDAQELQEGFDPSQDQLFEEDDGLPQ